MESIYGIETGSILFIFYLHLSHVYHNDFGAA